MPASHPQKNTDNKILEDRTTQQHQPTTVTATGASHHSTNNGTSLPTTLEKQGQQNEPVDPKHVHQQQQQQQQQQKHDSRTTTTATTTHPQQRQIHVYYDHSRGARDGAAAEAEEEQMSSVSSNTSNGHHPPFHTSATAAAASSAASMPAGGSEQGYSARNSTDSRRSSMVGARSVAQPSQSPRNLTPSPTMMPQRHLGLLLRQSQGQGFGAMVGNALSGARSIVGSMVGGGGSVASGHGTPGSVAPTMFSNQPHHASVITGGGSVAGRSPVLTSEDSAEQTLLLVRPTWVQDQAVSDCAICARTFTAVRRKHHCRQCGRVVCHDCSSRSLVLPQLGYTKAVRVCDDCFDVAYLVAYILSDDLGPTTQIHGARGLYDIVEGESERAIQSALDHGGLDAMVFLCRLNHSYELHALATSFLATLTDKGEQMHPLIVARRAMPNLYHLVTFYGHVQQQQHLQRRSSPTDGSPTRTAPSVTAYAINPTPMPLTRMGSLESVHTRTTKRIETITLIMMNVTHVVFRMVSGNKDLSRQLARDGGLDSLMTLSVYFPAGVRTRAMEDALKTMAQHAREQQPLAVPQRPSSAMSSLSVSDHDLQSERSSTSGRASSLDLAEVPGGGSAVDEDDEDNLLIHMDEWFHQRLEGMQQLAAKSISIMASDPVNQAYMIDDPERVDRLVQLLYSTNPDVVKYAAKTTAFLSLRNDKHKLNLVRGAGVAALLMVIRLAREQHFSESTEHDDQEQLPTESATGAIAVSRRSSSSPSVASGTIGGPKLSSEAVSHACCTLANLATSIESQDMLMSHVDLIHTICGVVGLYPAQTEVERHVSRLLANLALYDQNKMCLLTDFNTTDSPPVARPSSHPYRYSSPIPPPLRAKGNVVPTLMYIGAMTLELPSYASGFQDPLDPYHAYHPAAILPDASELVDSLQAPFEIPESATKETDNELDTLGHSPPQQHQYQYYPSYHQASNPYGSSPAGRHDLSSSPSYAILSITTAASDGPTAIIPPEAWRTVPGTEDIQRHFIRAIDNLLMSSTTDGISEQTFKVFLKLWPARSLILAIRATTGDEDTQRRATHVLNTLKQQQTIHQPFIEQYVEAHRQEAQRNLSQQGQQGDEDVREPLTREHKGQEHARKQHQGREDGNEAAARKLKQQQQAEAEEEEKRALKQKEEEAVRHGEEKREQERRDKEVAEERKKKEEEAEKKKQEERRRRQEQEEAERREKERIERERREKEEEEERRRKEAEEQEAWLLKEKEEKEEKERQERLRKEKEDKEREEHEARIQKEKQEAEETENRHRQQQEEEEKAALAKKQKEEEEAATAAAAAAKAEEEEEKARLEKQKQERERIRQNVEKLRKKMEEDRLQQRHHDQQPEAVDAPVTADELSSTTEDEAPATRSGTAANRSQGSHEPSSSDSEIPAGPTAAENSKTSSTSAKDKKKKKKKNK